MNFKTEIQVYGFLSYEAARRPRGSILRPRCGVIDFLYMTKAVTR
jgi:hypothetical protein